MEHTQNQKVKTILFRYSTYLFVCSGISFWGFICAKNDLTMEFWLTETILFVFIFHLIINALNLLRQLKNL
jgi:hypothetical protein